MSGISTYSLPATAAPKLEAMVDQIIARPGTMIDLKAMEQVPEQLDVNAVIAALPEVITEDDFVKMLRLAMLTESGTDSYAAVFQQGAGKYNANWLTRFNQKVWVPDEYTHTLPYYMMLRTIGFTEEELDRQIRELQARVYEHCCGISPVELTTFGTVQEYLTDNWHGLLATLLKPAAPQASYFANLVKRRETLHTVWYRGMTAIQVEENPELIELVAKTLSTFQMPGTQLVPDCGPLALGWMQRLNVDFNHVAKELVRNFSESAGNVKRSGMLLVEMAVAREYPIGPFPARFVRGAMNRLGGAGYGLLGEAVLEKVGLPMPAKWVGKPDSGIRFHTGIYEGIRTKMRTFIVNKIDIRSVTGDTAA
ncbi:MAG: hypothetical protein O2826_03045 [Chloroflexi bacterium]|nr:hypothetical protein [Chloroflexota bacterium]MDA1173478.1 hypothetical protein [Chloroflexota bacterium]